MDFFDIGSTALLLMRSVFNGLRRTGRTSRLLDNLRDGDVLIVESGSQYHYMQRALHALDKKVEVLIVDPRNPWDTFSGQGTKQGRIMFDHAWIESYYLNVVEHGTAELEHLQTKYGGYDHRHLDTALMYCGIVPKDSEAIK